MGLSCEETASRVERLSGASLGTHDGRGAFPKSVAIQRRSKVGFTASVFLAKARLFAVLRLAWGLVGKPLATGYASVWLVKTLISGSLARAGKLRVALFLVVADLVRRQFLAVLRDPVFRLALVGSQHNTAQAGLYVPKEDPRLQKIAVGAKLDKLQYKSPRGLLHGDLRTILPNVLYRPRPIRYHRFSFPSKAFEGEPHGISLDWSYPDVAPAQHSPIAIVLAGVGGDSNAPYVRDAVHSFTEIGWPACVLLARGLGNAPKVNSVQGIFNPANVTDVLEALKIVDALHDGQAPIVLVGFSLGGITLCNVLGRHADEIPSSVCGAVSISGAFECGPMDWERYESTYQKLIVPELLTEVLEHYGEQLYEVLGKDGLHHLVESNTYTHLFERLFAKLAEEDKAAPANFEAWRHAQAGAHHRHNISTPLTILIMLV